MKYRRYIPSYRREDRARQVTCNIEFIAAYFAALDEWRRTGKRAAIKGFSGWYVTKPGRDLD